MPLPDPLAASRSSRFRVGLGAAIMLLVVGLGVAVLVSALTVGGNGRTILRAPEPGSSALAKDGAAGDSAAGAGVVKSGAAIFVHILGAVNRPGLYQFRDGDRAIDAVAAAGGYTAEADRRQVNLARFLVDSEQIYVPAVGEAAEPGTTSGTGAAPGVVGGKVNLNTADAATLESLPRVGPAMAQRIIDWRQSNGRFSAIEDLMSVSGIGEKTFAQLKDRVTI